MTTLQDTAQKINNHLESIETYFKPGAKVTLLIRNPEYGDADMVMTSDTLDNAIQALQERKKKGSAL